MLLMLLSLDLLHSVRDVHQLRFHAFIVTRFAAVVAESPDAVVARSSAQCA